MLTVAVNAYPPGFGSAAFGNVTGNIDSLAYFVHRFVKHYIRYRRCGRSRRVATRNSDVYAGFNGVTAVVEQYQRVFACRQTTHYREVCAVVGLLQLDVVCSTACVVFVLDVVPINGINVIGLFALLVNTNPVNFAADFFGTGCCNHYAFALCVSCLVGCNRAFFSNSRWNDEKFYSLNHFTFAVKQYQFVIAYGNSYVIGAFAVVLLIADVVSRAVDVSVVTRVVPVNGVNSRRQVVFLEVQTYPPTFCRGIGYGSCRNHDVFADLVTCLACSQTVDVVCFDCKYGVSRSNNFTVFDKFRHYLVNAHFRLFVVCVAHAYAFGQVAIDRHRVHFAVVNHRVVSKRNSAYVVGNVSVCNNLDLRAVQYVVATVSEIHYRVGACGNAALQVVDLFLQAHRAQVSVSVGIEIVPVPTWILFDVVIFPEDAQPGVLGKIFVDVRRNVNLFVQRVNLFVCVNFGYFKRSLTDCDDFIVFSKCSRHFFDSYVCQTVVFAVSYRYAFGQSTRNCKRVLFAVIHKSLAFQFDTPHVDFIFPFVHSRCGYGSCPLPVEFAEIVFGIVDVKKVGVGIKAFAVLLQFKRIVIEVGQRVNVLVGNKLRVLSVDVLVNLIRRFSRAIRFVQTEQSVRTCFGFIVVCAVVSRCNCSRLKRKSVFAVILVTPVGGHSRLCHVNLTHITVVLHSVLIEVIVQKFQVAESNFRRRLVIVGHACVATTLNYGNVGCLVCVQVEHRRLRKVVTVHVRCD